MDQQWHGARFLRRWRREYDPESGEQLAELPVGIRIAEEAEVDAQLVHRAMAAVTPDGREVALVEPDGGAVVLHRDFEAKPVWRFGAATTIESVAISSSGHRVAVLDAVGTLTLLDVDTGRVVASPAAHPGSTLGDLQRDLPLLPGLTPAASITGRLGYVAFVPGQGSLVSARGDQLGVWDATTGQPTGSLFSAASTYGGSAALTTLVWGLEVSPGGVAAITTSSFVHLVDLASRQPIRSFRIPGASTLFGTPKVRQAVWINDGLLGVVTNQGSLVLADPTTGALVREQVRTQLGEQSTVAIDRERRRLASASVGGISVVSVDGRRLLAQAVPREAAVTLSLSKEGETLYRGIPTTVSVRMPDPAIEVATGLARRYGPTATPSSTKARTSCRISATTERPSSSTTRTATRSGSWCSTPTRWKGKR